MSYREGTWLGSPNFSPGRPGGISWVVLHTMVGSVASANARFQNATQQASAHYGVGEDGSLVQWVDEGDTAWHAGDFAVNQASIGIEHEDGGNYDSPRPDALYTRSAALVAAICARYSIPLQRGDYGGRIAGIIDHRTVYATACPDALDTDRIIREATQLFGPGGGSAGGVMSDAQFYQLLSVKYGVVLNADGSIAKDASGNPIPIPMVQSILTAIGAQHSMDPAALAQLEAEVAEIQKRVDKDLG